MPPPKQKPAHEIRLGRVKATIWENRTERPDVPAFDLGFKAID